MTCHYGYMNTQKQPNIGGTNTVKKQLETLKQAFLYCFFALANLAQCNLALGLSSLGGQPKTISIIFLLQLI